MLPSSPVRFASALVLALGILAGARDVAAQAACAPGTLAAYAGLGTAGCQVGGAAGVRFSGFGTSGAAADAARVVLTPFTTTLADGRAFYGLDVAYNGVLDQSVTTGTSLLTGYGFSGTVQALGPAGITGGRVLQFAPVFPGALTGGGYATVLIGSELFSQVCRQGPPPPTCGIDIPLDFGPRVGPVGFASSTFLDVEGAGGSVRLDRIRFGFATVSAVPEPGAVALVGAGLALTGGWRTARRRRQSRATAAR